MDHSITKRMPPEQAQAYRDKFKQDTQKATGRFLHFKSPEEWSAHQQQVAEAQKQTPF